MENKSEKAQQSMERVSQTMGDTVVDVLDRLAGKKSELKLTFEDLSLDTGYMKAKMSGSVVLETTVAKEAESTTAMTSERTAYYPPS
jgi:hypothetical protein